MQWTHHDKVVIDERTSLARGREVFNRIGKYEPINRTVLEGYLGSDAVPPVPTALGGIVSYLKAWIFGQPALVMTVADKRADASDQIHVWFSPEAQAAWRFYVDRDETILPPRKMARIIQTGDEAYPYLILGTRIRRWNASQDLPKALVGASKDDPDGNAFLSALGRKHWKPITHALVAEMVKEALRPVPETTRSRRYQVATLGDGQMIRYGSSGPTWVDAAAAVHLAGLAGYPLGYPEEISQSLGGEGWTRLSDILARSDDHAHLGAVEAEMKHVENISYAVFASEIGVPELKRVFPQYRWGRGGRHGERLRDDVRVRYSRMIYRGHPVLAAHMTVRGESGNMTGKSEIWLAFSAQASLIDSLSALEKFDDTPAFPDMPKNERVLPVRLRKRQRKAIDKLAKAISRLHDEGLVLVLQGGVLKAKVDDEGDEKEGLATVFPEAPVIPNID